MAFTVGFDLDMTLIDPRPGMAAVLNEVGLRTGHELDGDHFAANLGPPLDMVYREMGVPEEEIPDMVSLFRSLYPDVVIPATVALPGAFEALDCVRSLGGRTMVVTGKYRKNAALHLEALGWEVDHLFGELWAAGKADVLRLHDASVYVGDHVGDMKGALAAGAVGVGVLTGPCSADELSSAGAAVVLPDLRSFPEWLRTSGVTP